MIITTPDEWIADNPDIVQIPSKLVNDQLKLLDNTGNGLGYVFVLTPRMVDQSDNITSSSQINYEVTSHAVFKMKNQWYIVIDDNISEIAKAIVNIMTADININA